MGLLENFEQKLDRMVNGAFAKAFKSEVQPTEIGAGLTRELDQRAAVISRARTVVPNVFSVELSSDDYTRLTQYEETLCTEFALLVRQHAEAQRYSFVGPAEVTLAEDASLGTGVFRIRSSSRQGPGANAAVTPDVEGQPHLEVDGIVYPLGSVTRLGRGTDMDIRVDDPGCSRHHAEIVLGTDVVIRDLNSTNGTSVNGRRISSAVLADGARIQLGTTTLTYRAR